MSSHPPTIEQLYSYVMNCNRRLTQLRKMGAPDDVLVSEELLLQTRLADLWDACQAERN